ncbi:hypothetical protein BST61_g10282 [Cercospora zeina]
MDGIDFSHLSQDFALILRFGHHLAPLLPSPKWPLLYREDAMSRDALEQSDSEGDTPAPQRPYVYLVYDTCESIDFGRGSDVHVSLPRDYGISRRHFSLCCDPISNIWSVRCHSSTGVVVNGVRLTHVSQDDRWALNPVALNYLEAPGVSIKVVVHSRPWDSTGSHTRTRSRTIGRPTPDDTASTASESSVTQSMSSWIDGVETVRNPSRYIVLREDEWRLPWADRAWMAIDAKTGGAFAVTEFDIEKGDEMLRFYLEHTWRNLQHPNLLSHLDYERQGTMDCAMPALVQFSGSNIWSIAGGIPQQELGAAARQMMSVLSYLQKNKIYHGRIRADVITYQRSGLSGHYNYRLTGLWERWIDPHPHDTSSQYSILAKRDMATMGIVLVSALPKTAPQTSNDYGFVGLDSLAKPVDPVLYQILWLASCASTGSSIQFQEHLAALLGVHGHGPFFTTQLSRPVNLNIRKPCEHSEPEVSVCDIAALWEWCMRTGYRFLMSYRKQCEILSQLRRHNGYVTMQELDSLAERHGAVFNILSPRIPQSADNKWSITVNAEVHWLRGGTMINLTQFLESSGLALSIPLPEDRTIEMRGATAAKGLYVDYDWLRQQEILRRSSPNLLRPPNCAGWPTTQLTAFPYTHYVMFATDLPWSSIVVMERSTGATHWQPTISQSLSFGASIWLTYDQTVDLCEEYGLDETMKAMREYREGDTLCAPINDHGRIFKSTYAERNVTDPCFVSALESPV